tara:strand:+ start:394 stop:639 length:246 start_codon:yes stop_codon:yes gene_type:complete
MSINHNFLHILQVALLDPWRQRMLEHHHLHHYHLSMTVMSVMTMIPMLAMTVHFQSLLMRQGLSIQVLIHAAVMMELILHN